MDKKNEELIIACKEGHLYDFIASKAYLFDKNDLIEILKNLDYAIYKRLGEQSIEVEQSLPECLDEYAFFGEDITADERAYFGYLAGNCSYQEYIKVCEHEDIKEPRPRK